MPSHPSEDDEVASAIVRVLSGDLPEREEIELRRWLDADPDRRRLFEEIRAVWDEAAAQQPWDTSELRERIVTARQERAPTARPTLEHGSHGISSITSVASRRRPASRLIALAAAVTFLAVGSVTWWHASHRERPAVVSVALHEVATRRGQRAALQLPDGSRITLGAATTLRYPEGLDTARAREVFLAGDAYFEVAHDASRPFVVRTALALARDLGTKFLVRAHDDVPYVDVVVVEGLVSLRSCQPTARLRVGSEKSCAPPAPPAPDSLLLNVADLGRLDSAGNLGTERDIDLSSVLAWVRGQVTFRNTPVAQVLAEIGRSYDVRVRIGDPMLRDLRFTGSFGAAPPSEVVADFAKAIGAVAERDTVGFVLVRRGAR